MSTTNKQIKILSVVTFVMVLICPCENYAKAQFGGDVLIRLIEWHPNQDIIAIVIDKDKNVVTQDDQVLGIYSSDGSLISTLHIGTAEVVQNILWSFDGDKLAVNTYDNTGADHIYMWDMHDPKSPALNPLFPSEHPTSVSLGWSPDGKLLANNEYDQVKIWNVIDGTLFTSLDTIATPDFVRALVWSQKTNHLAAMDGNYVYIWDMNDANSPLIQKLSFSKYPSSISWSPLGIQLAVADYDVITIWEWNTLAQKYIQVEQLSGHSALITKLDWSGNYIASIGLDNVYIWDTVLWQTIDVLENSSIAGAHRALSLDNDGIQLGHTSLQGTFVISEIPLTINTFRTKLSECVSDKGFLNSLNTMIDAEQWQAFINEVEAQRDKKIMPQCADMLVEMAYFLLGEPQ